MKASQIKGKLRAAVPRQVTWAALAALGALPGGALLWGLTAGGFAGEIGAVFRGMLQHQSDVLRGGGGAGRIKLRRCVHRLEKGLIMRPRRGIFGLDYIGLAVQLYGPVHTAQDEQAIPLRRWAGDVLSAYFAVAESHPTIDAARDQFDAIRTQPPGRPVDRTAPVGRDGGSSASPYRRDLSPLAVDYAGLKELAERRRSVRWFRQEPVPHELIDRALEVGAQAPSACNRQPFEFRFYDDPELVAKLSKIPMGTSGIWHNFPCVCVLVGDMSAFAHQRDRHLVYIDGSLATMGFQLALETLGLSSCCLNWPDVPRLEKRVRDVIALEEHERIVMFMAIGYPDPEGGVPHSEKRPLDGIRSWNRS